MRLVFLALAAAMLLGGCKASDLTSKLSSSSGYKPGPIGDTGRWQLWYVGNEGYTLEPTPTSDAVEARVQGTDRSTLIAACNGNDPTAFLLAIETRGEKFQGLTQPFEIEVLSDGRRLYRDQPEGVADNGQAFPNDYEAPLRLSRAMRAGSDIILRFAEVGEYKYTLRGSSKIMNQMACDRG